MIYVRISLLADIIANKYKNLFDLIHYKQLSLLIIIQIEYEIYC